MGLAEGYRGAVRAHECDAAGVMRPDGVIARVWDGVPNLRNRGAGLGVKEEGMGSAALEYRVAYLRPLRAGQLVTVCSGLRALGEKTTTWTHLLHDGQTGAPVAAAEAVHVVGWTAQEVRETLGIRAAVLATDPLAVRYGERPWMPWAPDVAAARFKEELAALQARAGV